VKNPARKTSKIVVAAGFIFVVLISIGIFGNKSGSGGSSTPSITGALAAPVLSDAYKQVSSDAVEQYNIAARNGSPMDKCVRAQMVSAAYIQAKDETNYKIWKQKEKSNCKAAGLPQ
jgi:hypothetical protein